ncbi:hypothetical protein [Myxococcus sp. RHSTA-1-4]|uniref:hypothetical protein n=1 Tax=Myxococcus sp. RHSTA-1-4 TaxID=2874601 RepID=UPI001CBDCA09|nr:hypothetical protein [Myxococcus sp. RHSTA-1-4]MBZ4418727.1 hypothetical protein [Myxococcus sp. RHSTA-1-4]
MTAVAQNGDGSQTMTNTHAMPTSRATFLADFASGRLQIGVGHAFFTALDTQANNARQNATDPLHVSYEWPVDYVTPPSLPPGVINVAPGNPRNYLHAHAVMTENGTQFTNLHVKPTPTAGISYALQVGDANGLHLTVQL